MGVQRWVKLGFDTINLLGSVSKFLAQQKDVARSPTRRVDGSAPDRQRAPRTLHDIGLDDVEFGIYIDLSQNRTNFKVWCPFDEDFRVAIKETLPKSDRRWDAVDRCWRVAVRHIGTLHDLLQSHYLGVPISFTERAAQKVQEILREVDAHNARVATEAGQNFHIEDDELGFDPYDALGVTEDAPDEVIKAAFKAQARMCHPDRGGKEQDMQHINAAFEAIRRERRWKT